MSDEKKETNRSKERGRKKKKEEAGRWFLGLTAAEVAH